MFASTIRARAPSHARTYLELSTCTKLTLYALLQKTCRLCEQTILTRSITYLSRRELQLVQMQASTARLQANFDEVRANYWRELNYLRTQLSSKFGGNSDVLKRAWLTVKTELRDSSMEKTEDSGNKACIAWCI